VTYGRNASDNSHLNLFSRLFVKGAKVIIALQKIGKNRVGRVAC